MSPFLILLIIALALGFYVMSVYNSLQQLKTQIKAAIQEIGNQLKRQASLLPNLESAVKSYMKQEKEIFKMLTDARKTIEQADKTGAASDIEAAVSKLNELVPKINIVVEDNPEMKSDGTVTQFMAELRDTADKLMYARRSVIDLSQAFNVKLVTFPSNMIATTFGFKEEKGLDIPTTGAHVSVSKEEMTDFKSSL